MPTNRETVYLQRVLQLNPLEESTGILATRRAFQHADDAAPLFVEERPFEERHRIAGECLDRLRQDFWSLDKQQLAARLNELDVTDFPDLAVGVSRMKAAAERREAFRRLEKHPHCFPQFLEGFTRLVIAAPRKAADIRRAELAQARGGIAHPVYRSAREYKRIARVVEQEFPELFVLEEEWLRKIVGKNNRIRLPKSAPYIIWYLVTAIAVFVFLPKYIIGYLVGIGMVVLVKLLLTEFQRKS